MVATLYFIEDFSYQQIAEVLECPVGTVRSRLHRGGGCCRRPCGKSPWSGAIGPGRGGTSASRSRH